MLIFSPDIDRIKSSADRKSNTNINSSGGNFSIKEEAISKSDCKGYQHDKYLL
jgi:hypothetical protein